MTDPNLKERPQLSSINRGDPARIVPVNSVTATQKPKLLDQVRHAIRIRHYSPRTEETYLHWIKRFIFFHNKRHPAEMGEKEIARFLSSLASEQHVSASTQNQALNAILFLYRHVLSKDIGYVDGVIRANRPKRLPTVLTRQEVKSLLDSEVRLMTTRVVATITASVFAVLMATPGFTCTTLCLFEKGRALVAYNYDAWASEGLLLVNKRGTSKKGRANQGASWTARYGSVTFNQFGRDEPSSGVNEKGLMVSLMWVDGARYPPADHRPIIGPLRWIQYHLDNHASVAEVVANTEAVRIASAFPLHYLFADASGDAAVIEFLDGKLLVYRGETLPVRALANSTYADSTAAFEAAKKTGEMPTSHSSLDRFVRGAMLVSGDGDPIARGFAALAAVASPGITSTRWSIVYDLGASVVHFRTDTNEAIRRFTARSFDFSCRTPMKMLDVTAPGSGDVATAFVDYSRAANRALLEASYTKTPFLRGTSDTERTAAGDHADATSACAVTE